jgi:chromosome segregation ATPase
MGWQNPVRLFIDESVDNQSSGSAVESSPLTAPSTSWAAATISMRSQFQTAVNEKKIAERTVRDLLAMQGQFEVQHESLLREYEAKSSAAEECENEVHALTAEVRRLKGQIKHMSMNLGVVESDSKGPRSSQVFRDNGVCDRIVFPF